MRPAATTGKKRPRRDFTTPAGGFAIGFSLITDASDQYLDPSAPTPPGPSKRFDSWLQFGQDGSVTVFIENWAIGVEAHTAFRQIVAEELDLAADQVKVTLGKSDSTCNQDIGGDRPVPIDVHSLRDASSRARGLLLAAASKRLRASAYMLDVTEGVVAPRFGLSRRVSYAELVSEINPDQSATSPGVTFNIDAEAKPHELIRSVRFERRFGRPYLFAKRMNT